MFWGQAICQTDSKLKQVAEMEGREFIRRQDKKICYFLLDKRNDVLFLVYVNMHMGTSLTLPTIMNKE